MEHIKIGTQPPLSFEVASGECLAVEGPSGAGKTRLLRAVADLDPGGGRVFLDGAERSEIPAPAWRSLVRFVAAEPGWWTDTAREAIPGDDARLARVARMVIALGLNAADLDKPLAVLSTGERQRLSLARGLADDPKVLLLDEPTAGLDGAAAALVEELLRSRLSSGAIIILASHDMPLLIRLATARLPLARKPEAARAQP